MKASLPTQADKIGLMKIDLRIAGRLTGDESDQAIIALYNRLRDDRARKLFEAEQRRAAECKRQQLDRNRDWLRGRGVNPDDLNESQVIARMEEIRGEEQRKRAAEDAARQEAEQRRQQERLFRASACPIRHVVNLDHIDAEKCSKWAAIRNKLSPVMDRGHLFVLLGIRGTGKTQLAVSLIHQATRGLMSARYITALDLLREIRASFNGSSEESEAAIISRLTTCKVLVIDEMHQRSGSAFEENTLVSIIDTRYRQCLFTVLISNQSLAEFSASVGDSIVSRLHESGEAIICDWPTFRRPGSWKKSRQPSVEAIATE
jgi:DNA replication protein DnaC